ncbi:MAG: Na+/H+ antiporter NhaD and related arsenite permeases [uncultured Rubrobacteraceae bacterium]|uniref:Na+/H+ antiporter NhaD and related arsenite permeases n=1 Tax=uncultured Rubrobacteraceae bacterium TaxID=349277 RepID=A0A6J4RBQ1_9ACTN|nr:MAG: Na+/H+ antiporter NhaD and related arsenite permeases [uncultured Rubrobacteraceae bacterium]
MAEGTLLAIFAALVFVAVLALFAAEKVHRTPAALMGAVLVVVAGAIGQEEAIEAVNWETLGLLIGMMILVGILRETGLFSYLAIRTAQLADGRPGRILVYLGVVTAVLSAFLDNVTTVLLMFPMTLLIADILDEDPVPFLLLEVIASNIGGTATLVGDPPNIIIGTATGLSFNSFIVNLGPPVVVVLVVTLAILWLAWGRKMRPSEENRRSILALDPASSIQDRGLLLRAGGVMAATVLGFFMQDLTGLNPAVVALAGAALAMIVCRSDVEKSLGDVEWPTILFFVGLFVMVGALESVGIIGAVADYLGSASDSLGVTAVTILWGSAVASAVVDNIPFTATMIPVVEGIGEARGYDASTLATLWWSLSLGACLGGNATLIGASANLVVAGMAERHGLKISFVRFMLAGLPLTVIAIAISTAYVLLFLV